ncbi:MAG: hypothetical protein L3J28_13455 [Candidatus Polarisedimenticolaceae bacterium]|nr:hypothetical protein [Candidatus Polarisedimenticolaceae bacterium]
MHRKNFSSPAIFQHNIPRLMLLILVGLVLLCVAAALGYKYGRSVEMGGLAPIERVTDLQRQLTAVEYERAELHKRLVKQERSSTLDLEMVKAAKIQQQLLQEERSSMAEELAFLRNIVSTNKQKKGLRIQNFRLEKDLEASSFRYRFSVSQVLKDSTTVVGRIYLSVIGLQDGKKKRLKLEKLSEEKIASIKMRFRYFQEVDEILHLPEGFVADTLTLEVKPKNRGVAALTETFEWRLNDT